MRALVSKACTLPPLPADIVDGHPFIEALRAEHRPLLAAAFCPETVCIVLPQRYTLATVDISRSLIETHIICFSPELSWQFASLNATRGIVSLERDSLSVLGSPDQIDQFAFFSDPSSIFTSISDLEDNPGPQEAHTVSVVREGSVRIGDADYAAMVVSQPLTFPGTCPWVPGAQSAPRMLDSPTPAATIRRSTLRIRTRATAGRRSGTVSDLLGLISSDASAPSLFSSPGSPRSESDSDDLPALATGSAASSAPSAPVAGPSHAGEESASTGTLGSARDQAGTSNTTASGQEQEVDDPEADVAADAAAFEQVLAMPSALPLRRDLDAFCRAFATKTPPPGTQRVHKARRATARIRAALRAADLATTAPSVDAEAALRGVESVVISRVYEHLHPVNGPEDRAKDAALSARLRTVTFVRPEHLDISPRFMGALWQEGLDALLRIRLQKSPAGKEASLVRSCRALLGAASEATGKSGVGADDLMPLIIYTVLRANPPGLAADLAFLTAFRPQCSGEAGYYLTNLASAVGFLEQLTPKALSIDAAEFRDGVARAQQQAARRSAIGRVGPLVPSEAPMSTAEAALAAGAGSCVSDDAPGTRQPSAAPVARLPLAVSAALPASAAMHAAGIVETTAADLEETAPVPASPPLSKETLPIISAPAPPPAAAGALAAESDEPVSASGDRESSRADERDPEEPADSTTVPAPPEPTPQEQLVAALRALGPSAFSTAPPEAAIVRLQAVARAAAVAVGVTLP
jgi:hypothetical protein